MNILNYFSLWIIAYLIGIGLITYLVYIRIKKDWSKRVKAPKYQGDTYKGETFRNPLNLSIAVIAILAPLSSGLLAYQIGTNPSAKIDSLIVGILVMLVAMIWGVYLSYGIATQCTDDDKIQITRENNWLLPADFVTQLSLLILGVICLIIFLLFYFKPIPVVSTSVKTTVPAQSVNYPVLRPKPQIGISPDDLVNLWGSPEDKLQEPGNISVYKYSSPKSVYTIRIKNNRLYEIVETSK